MKRYKYDYQQIRQAFDETGTYPATAERVGLPLKTVTDILNKMGIRVGRGNKRQHDYQEVLRLFQELGNQHRVAERLGILPSTVSKILCTQGIRLGKGTGRPVVHELPMTEIASRYLAGESTIELAQDYDVDSEVIRRRLRSKGVSRRGVVESRARGSKNGQWKGGKEKTMHYYRRQSYEVAAICLGQPVPLGWIIHHIDENPKNNQPVNLSLFPSPKLHLRFHQLLLRLQRTGQTVDAIQLVLENGGQMLPPPPNPIVFPDDTSQPAP